MNQQERLGIAIARARAAERAAKGKPNAADRLVALLRTVPSLTYERAAEATGYALSFIRDGVAYSDYRIEKINGRVRLRDPAERREARKVRKGKKASVTLSLDAAIDDFSLGLVVGEDCRFSPAPTPEPDAPEWWEAAVSSLTGKHREIVLMRFRDGITRREIGDEFGLTENEVWRVEQEAIERLKDDPKLPRRLGCV